MAGSKTQAKGKKNKAVGSVKVHQQEEKELVAAALGIRANAVPVAKGTPATATTQTAASQ